MRPFISANSVSCSASVSASAAVGVGVLGLEIGADSGSSTDGSRITSCQLSARSQAIVVGQRDAVPDRRSAGALARGAAAGACGSSIVAPIERQFVRVQLCDGCQARGASSLSVSGANVSARAVHAVALAGRLRPVGKDVAEMGIAVRAADFGAPHEPRAVVVLARPRPAHRRIEARPAGAGIELGRRTKTAVRRSRRSCSRRRASRSSRVR